MSSEPLARRPAPRRPHREESGFAAWCIALCQRDGELDLGGDFPLHDGVRLRSDLRRAFPAQEFTLERARRAGTPPTLRVRFLTLAGVDGALPNWVGDSLAGLSGREGAALHAFLDLLNRRFWELFVVSQSVVNNAHFSVLNARASGVLSEVSLSVAGLGAQAASGLDSAQLRLVQQHCLAAARGVGGRAALEHLLAELVGQPIWLSEHVPTRLETVSQTRQRLGRHALALTRARGELPVLGMKAWVACGLTVALEVSEPAQARAFLPLGNARHWQAIRHILGTFYAGRLPPLRLRLRLHADVSCATFGSPHLRLGWGARVGGARRTCELINVSRRMLERTDAWRVPQ